VHLKNKKMQTIKPHFFKRIRPGLAAMGLSILVLAFGVSPIVKATNYQAEINNLNAQNAQSQSALNSLQVQAGSYQQTIDAYQAQITAIDNSIATNQAKQAQYEQQIAADNIKIAQNKAYLSDDLKTMYVQGQMTTIEQLATSSNLSTFVNKQEDDIKVQDNLSNLLTTIKNLQQQAQNNKNQVVALLQTENAQQAQVTSDQNQVNQLLAMNQQQQSNYNSQISANNSQISILKAEQAAANAAIARSVDVRASGGTGGACDIGYGNGGYPYSWCNDGQDSILDANGFPNRECTSFAYWYFTTEEGQSNFQVSGNAGWWWETSNYPVSTYPNVQVGAVGVEPSTEAGTVTS
jgi:peptidoglycan hydrolase CwlO-like protein